MLLRMAAMWDFTMCLDHKCGGAFIIQATSRPALSACLMEAQELGLLKALVDHSAPPDLDLSWRPCLRLTSHVARCT